MTLSELIAKLKELQDEYGDLPVWAQGSDDGSYEVEGIEIFRSLRAAEDSDAVFLTDMDRR